MRKPLFAFLMMLLSTALLYGDSISFNGGYTRMTMKEGNKEIVLSSGAHVTTGSLTLDADTITLSGDDYQEVDCSGSVKVIDTEKGLTVTTGSLFYDRKADTLIIEGWVEVDDTGNEVAASAGTLLYNMESGTMEMEGHVRLLRAASKGVMVCTSDQVTYQRDKKTLRLIGNAVITWQGDTYQAHAINVDLESEEIVMEGSIQGTVHG